MAQKNLFPKKVTREELNSLVDRAADLIRTAVDYKFILTRARQLQLGKAT